MNYYKLILAILGTIVIILVLLQGGRTNGLSFTNNDLNLFAKRKNDGLEKKLEISTAVLTAGIMAITLFAF